MQRTLAIAALTFVWGSPGFVATAQGLEGFVGEVPEPRGPLPHVPTLIETFHEDFESQPVGALVENIPDWFAVSAAVVADLSSQFPELGSRAGFIEDFSVFGTDAVSGVLAQAPFSEVEWIGVASIDFVLGAMRETDVVWIRFQDQTRGILINQVFFYGTGDILFLGQAGTVDSGVDWTPGELISLEFEQTLKGQVILRINGEVIGLAPNFDTTHDFISFTHVLIAASFDAGVPEGSLAFDNVSYQHAQLPDTGCGRSGRRRAGREL